MGSMGSSAGPFRVRYNGLFDFDGLYAAIIDWAKNYGYRWHESTYKHKVPTPKGAEQQFAWELTKNVTEYINYTINMKVHTWDSTEVEVSVDGKSKALTNGRIDILVNGKIIWDWQKKFGGSKFAKKLGEWYGNILFAKDIESIHWDTLTYRIWNLQAIMKKFFEMQSHQF